jgi:hypothetical protein
MEAQRLGDMGADRHHRIERRHRLLEDHGDAIAADRRHLALAERSEVATVEPDRPARHPARFLQEPHDGQCRHALAAAALAHQGHGLMRIDREADAVDDGGRVRGRPEGDCEVFDFQQRHEEERLPLLFYSSECLNDRTFRH